MPAFISRLSGREYAGASASPASADEIVVTYNSDDPFGESKAREQFGYLNADWKVVSFVGEPLGWSGQDDFDKVRAAADAASKAASPWNSTGGIVKSQSGMSKAMPFAIAAAGLIAIVALTRK